MNAAEQDSSGFSQAERDAIKQRADELRSQKGLKGQAKIIREYEACLEAIGALNGLDRVLAERFHVIVSEEAPNLAAKTWYGFPSYARDGKVVTFVQPAEKFSSRYPTVGFSEDAMLDEGNIWATSFAVIEMTEQVETKLRELVRRAAGTV